MVPVKPGRRTVGGGPQAAWIIGARSRLRDDALAEGLHESVVTTALLSRLHERADLAPLIADVDRADQANVLATHLGRTILHSLQRRPEGDENGRLEIVRRVLDLLGAGGEGIY